MSCLWALSPLLSVRRSIGILLAILEMALFGSAARPSNNNTNNKSTRRKVSRTHLKSSIIESDEGLVDLLTCMIY